MANTVTFSRGDSFACSWTWNPAVGELANLIGTTISSSLEDRQSNVYAMTVTKAGDGLSFTVTYPGSTADWAIGLGKWDIKFVFSGGTVSRSQIFRVNVIDSVTV